MVALLPKLVMPVRTQAAFIEYAKFLCFLKTALDRQWLPSVAIPSRTKHKAAGNIVSSTGILCSIALYLWRILFKSLYVV